MHAGVQRVFIPGTIPGKSIRCGLKTWRECADKVCEQQAAEVSSRQDLPIVTRQGVPSCRLSIGQETYRLASSVPAAADLLHTNVVVVHEAR
jgi:hypothetical protein